MSTIAFTICSNNYLNKALVLLKSIKSQNAVPVYLFLADEKSDQINYAGLGFEKVITPDELDIPNLQWQLENYNVVEFNTAIKGVAFKYLFKHTGASTVYYFDPDIKVYRPINAFEQFWENTSILLTPHILEPIPFDGLFPGENLFLNHGIYNLGFLGLKRSGSSDKFLNWWCERLAEKCVIDLKEGYFTDQIWFNLVPLLFKDVTVAEHPGLNAAYWNLHDRSIKLIGGNFKVNDTEDLFFYHFSSFDKFLKQLMPRADGRFTFENRPEMIKLYTDYLYDLQKENSHDYNSINYYNSKYPFQIPSVSLAKRITNKIIREIKN
ncbi:hypothetical protein GS399_17775 [Pedobacter sp. HMF7647]|uniref:Glycosyl transferase n=1 Tax=Hufsiella arboris TaxID=2695275 RepID=A0A7K1YE10_9SPHI|nr:hypothetical protein [Hufsiella arboris]MXV52825.1 hypothetical protein [Hufsiella arboris]